MQIADQRARAQMGGKGYYRSDAAYLEGRAYDDDDDDEGDEDYDDDDDDDDGEGGRRRRAGARDDLDEVGSDYDAEVDRLRAKREDPDRLLELKNPAAATKRRRMLDDVDDDDEE